MEAPRRHAGCTWIGLTMNNERIRLLTITNRITQYARGLWYPAPVQSATNNTAADTATTPAPTATARKPTEPTPATHLSSQSRPERLKALYARIAPCTKCPLHQHRTQTVPGSGVLDPDVLIIGEAPGANEDKYGKPFIGKAGRYLDKWLESIDIYRTQNAYIANIIKCRPPQNRDPTPHEIAQCKPYLEEQIDIVRPKTILIVGRIAARHLFDINDSLAAMRTNQHTFRSIPTLITYHPSAVLRNPSLRPPVWEDLKKLKRLIAEQ